MLIRLIVIGDCYSNWGFLLWTQETLVTLLTVYAWVRRSYILWSKHWVREQAWCHLFQEWDLMYWHNLLRINWTTYDVCWSQDTINPNTDHQDIMLLSPQKVADPTSPCHEYQYTWVLGIFYVDVICIVRNHYHLHHIEFLWVQYFEIMENVSVQKAWSTAQLDIDKIKFRPMGANGAFRFVDPNQVIHACHLIPRFCGGKSQPMPLDNKSTRPLSAFTWDC